MEQISGFIKEAGAILESIWIFIYDKANELFIYLSKSLFSFLGDVFTGKISIFEIIVVGVIGYVIFIFIVLFVMADRCKREADKMLRERQNVL